MRTTFIDSQKSKAVYYDKTSRKSSCCFHKFAMFGQ